MLKMIKHQGSNAESTFSVETSTGISVEPQISVPKLTETLPTDCISLATLITVGWIIHEIRLLIIATK